MATDLEQRRQVVELLGEGSARRIHVIVASILALVGVVLQGLVYWHAVQMADKEWGTVGMPVWAFAVGAWILIMGLLMALLRQRLEDMREGRSSKDQTGPTLHSINRANQTRDGEFRSGCFTTIRSRCSTAFPAQSHLNSGLSHRAPAARRPDGIRSPGGRPRRHHG